MDSTSIGLAHESFRLRGLAKGSGKREIPSLVHEGLCDCR